MVQQSRVKKLLIYFWKVGTIIILGQVKAIWDNILQIFPSSFVLSVATCYRQKFGGERCLFSLSRLQGYHQCPCARNWSSVIVYIFPTTIKKGSFNQKWPKNASGGGGGGDLRAKDPTGISTGKIWSYGKEKLNVNPLPPTILLQESPGGALGPLPNLFFTSRELLLGPLPNHYEYEIWYE